MKKIQLTNAHKEKLFQIPLFLDLPLNIKESLLDKLDFVIYAADKIEPTRGYDSSTMIDMMEKDVDEGFIEVLKENRKYYNEKNFFVNTPLQLECFKYYLK